MHTIHTQDGEPPVPAAVSTAFLIADLAEAETRYRLQLGREMYWLGYRQAEYDMAARWNEIARHAVRGISRQTAPGRP
jgi:hypothetical protein